ncbi:MAG: patatin-like phospholipase family protein [Candidatus Rhabdochlamydia sp.]
MSNSIVPNPNNYDIQKEINFLENMVNVLPNLEENEASLTAINQLSLEEQIIKIGAIKEQIFKQILALPLNEWKDVIPQEYRSDLIDSHGTPLIYAVLRDGFSEPSEIIGLFKDFQADIMKATDREGRNALHASVACNQKEVVLSLMSEGTFSILTKDSFNRSPLYYAISSGQSEVLDALLKKGAASEKIQVPRNQLNKFLGLEITGQEVSTSSEKIDVSPLAIAVAFGDIEKSGIEIFNKLLEYGDNPINPFNIKSTISGIGNLIHLAILTHKIDMLTYLIRQQNPKMKKLITQHLEQGTPLQLASYLGDKESVRLLCEQQVDPNFGDGTLGGTALHYAAKGWSQDRDTAFRETIQELISWGANPKATNTEVIPSAILKKETLSYNFLSNTTYQQHIDKTQPPKFHENPPFNLAFQGGGSKGLAYIGALRALEQKKLLSKVQRVAGTSAGSIIATLLAVGYKLDDGEQKLENVVDRNFIDLLGINETKTYHIMEDLKVKTVVFNVLKGGLSHLLKPNRTSLRTKVIEYIQSLLSLEAVSDGEVFREWIDGLITEKTGKKNLTFGELSELIKEEPGKYKHLHIISAQYENKRFKSVEFKTNDNLLTDKESKEWSENWKDLIISDAVRASVSIPYIFSPHTIHFKLKGERTVVNKPEYRNFIDGGVVRNYPLELFDHNRFQEERSKYGEQTNFRVLGLNLHERPNRFKAALEPLYEKSFIEKITGDSLLKGIVATYLNLGEILVDEKQWNRDRTIAIPIEDVTAVTMRLTPEQKANMIEGGKLAAESFLLKTASI